MSAPRHGWRAKLPNPKEGFGIRKGFQARKLAALLAASASAACLSLGFIGVSPASAAISGDYESIAVNVSCISNLEVSLTVSVTGVTSATTNNANGYYEGSLQIADDGGQALTPPTNTKDVMGDVDFSAFTYEFDNVGMFNLWLNSTASSGGVAAPVSIDASKCVVPAQITATGTAVSATTVSGHFVGTAFHPGGGSGVIVIDGVTVANPGQATDANGDFDITGQFSSAGATAGAGGTLCKSFTVQNSRGEVSYGPQDICWTPYQAPANYTVAYSANCDGSWTATVSGLTAGDEVTWTSTNYGHLARTVIATGSSVSLDSASGLLPPLQGNDGSFTFYVGANVAGTISPVVPASCTPPPVNHDPVAVNHTATTAENTAVTVNVLAGSSDPDGDSLTVSGATGASHGTTSVASNQVVYTPATGFTGTDSFTYTISDGNGGTATATVSVTVSAAVTPPPVTQVCSNLATVNDTATTPENTAVTVNVLGNDTVNGTGCESSLRVTSVTQPEHGTAAVVNSTSELTSARKAFTAGGTAGGSVAAGVVKYTPATGFTGTDSFTYTVTDKTGATATGTVTVTVTASTSSTPPPNTTPPAHTTPPVSSQPTAPAANTTPAGFPAGNTGDGVLASTGGPNMLLLELGIALAVFGLVLWAPRPRFGARRR